MQTMTCDGDVHSKTGQWHQTYVGFTTIAMEIKFKTLKLLNLIKKMDQSKMTIINVMLKSNNPIYNWSVINSLTERVNEVGKAEAIN